MSGWNANQLSNSIVMAPDVVLKMQSIVSISNLFSPDIFNSINSKADSSINV